MPISRQSLSETLSDDLASLHKARAALSNAWALRMSASLKAHFAAACPPAEQRGSGGRTGRRAGTAGGGAGTSRALVSTTVRSRSGRIARGPLAGATRVLTARQRLSMADTMVPGPVPTCLLPGAERLTQTARCVAALLPPLVPRLHVSPWIGRRCPHHY